LAAEKGTGVGALEPAELEKAASSGISANNSRFPEHAQQQLSRKGFALKPAGSGFGGYDIRFE
jgi:hypothetical protein